MLLGGAVEAAWSHAEVLRKHLWVLVYLKISSVCAWGLQEELCLSCGADLHLPGHLSAHPRATAASLVHDGGPVAPWEWGSKQG